MTGAASAADTTPLKRTPLYDLHVALGAKTAPFAGYDMPIQYPTGVLKEHLATRARAGVFDVSHMGQAFLIADDGRHETVAAALEALVPADILNLAHGRQRYSQLLNERGGIIDDLMVTRSTDTSDDGRLMLVVNAACKDGDYAHIASRLPSGVNLLPAIDRALIAIQGPASASIVDALAADPITISFMSARALKLVGFDCHVSRSGYTGEDGFEISLAEKNAADLWTALLKSGEAVPVGLGARDSLRLEAGLCLYGHDIDETTSPVEANLIWSIQKRRREGGGFPGATRIQSELKNAPARKRVGIKPEGRAPAREGTDVLSQSGEKIGVVTSGGFGPSVDGPIAMGYVAAAYAAPGTPLQLIVRGKALAASVVTMPFAAHRYHRSA